MTTATTPEDTWNIPPRPTGPEPLHCVEVEASLLSSYILDPGLRAKNTLAAKHFFHDAHQIILPHVLTLDPIDLPILAHALRQADQLNRIGGTSFLFELLDAPHTTAIEHYCKIIRDLYIARQTSYALELAASKIRNNVPTLEAMNELRTRLKEMKE